MDEINQKLQMSNPFFSSHLPFHTIKTATFLSFSQHTNTHIYNSCFIFQRLASSSLLFPIPISRSSHDVGITDARGERRKEGAVDAGGRSETSGLY